MLMKGQIIKIHSDLYYVKPENGPVCICKIREILKKQKVSVVTGDFVEFDNDVIFRICPRKSFIKRPAVSNIDQIVIVSALKQPELDFHQLNRYITLAKYYKIPIVLCFNKEDLGLESFLQDRILSVYGALKYKIVFTSALEKMGIDDFASVLKNKTSALCGNSGVGKSSLINALNPKINLKTKSVSEKSNRGTHTTRHCEIVPINEDTYIVDTPGFSNVKFDFIMPKDVDLFFEEIRSYKSGCKFSDCLHINEAGCNVLKNLDKIDSSRYESYVAFVQEAFEYKQRVKFNGVKEETHQKFQHNKEVAKISEKKRMASRSTQRQKIYREIDEDEN